MDGVTTEASGCLNVSLTLDLSGSSPQEGFVSLERDSHATASELRHKRALSVGIAKPKNVRSLLLKQTCD